MGESVRYVSVGDLVECRAGGPEMTVFNITNTGTVECHFWSEWRHVFEQACFRASELRFVKEA